MRFVRRRSAALSVLAAALALVCPATALADRETQAIAQALFDEGRRLMSESKYREACPKLEESQRLDPALGTQFHLATCFAELGKTASAWSAFLGVADAAAERGDAERERVAREQAAALAKRLSRMRVIVRGRAPGQRIERDGGELGEAQWGMELPVDPGKHRLAASAPARQPFERTVDVPRGALVTLEIPELEPVTSADRRPGSALRTVALVTTASGGALLGLGLGLGLAAKARFDSAEPHCVENQCDAEGVSLRESAVDRGNVATVVFVLGAATIAGGITMWIVAPSSSEPSAGVALAPTGLRFGGSF